VLSIRINSLLSAIQASFAVFALLFNPGTAGGLALRRRFNHLEWDCIETASPNLHADPDITTSYGAVDAGTFMRVCSTEESTEEESYVRA
jgi:hypothetical protein